MNSTTAGENYSPSLNITAACCSRTKFRTGGIGVGGLGHVFKAQKSPSQKRLIEYSDNYSKYW